MPTLNAVIQDFVVGDDIDIVTTITNVPAGDTLAKAWFSVKAREDDDDALAIFSKSITSTLSATGQITDTGASGTGIVRFILTAADTVLMTGDKTYYFDLQTKTTAGKIYTPEKGKIVGKKQVTRATI